MQDPYKILNVSRNASDEEIKAAYKELIKKYHPDNYANNPLSDLANEKMQEVNNAYDEIMNQRRAQGSSNGAASMSEIRNMINSKRVVEAEEQLDRMPQQQRNAEWYFLKGSVFYARGWLDEALQHFKTAVDMNPNNPEYRSAYNQLLYQRSGRMQGAPNNQPYRTNQRTGGCSACDMCQGLICADCCCECMGGDLIRCC